MLASLLALVGGALSQVPSSNPLQPEPLELGALPGARRSGALRNLDALGLAWPHEASGVAEASWLPPVYFINLDRETQRRATITHDLLKLPTSSVTRIRATNESEIENWVNDGRLELEHVNIFNTSWNLKLGSYVAHTHSIFTLGELACTMSHLRSIREAYEAGAQSALILEDDVSLSHVQDWDSSLQELVRSAPAD